MLGIVRPMLGARPQFSRNEPDFFLDLTPLQIATRDGGSAVDPRTRAQFCQNTRNGSSPESQPRLRMSFPTPAVASLISPLASISAVLHRLLTTIKMRYQTLRFTMFYQDPKDETKAQKAPPLNAASVSSLRSATSSTSLLSRHLCSSFLPSQSQEPATKSDGDSVRST